MAATKKPSGPKGPGKVAGKGEGAETTARASGAAAGPIARGAPRPAAGPTSGAAREAKPKAERPKLRSSHGTALPKKRSAASAVKVEPRSKPTAKAPRGRSAAARAEPRVTLVDRAPRSRRPKAPTLTGAIAIASDEAREIAIAIAVAALEKKAHALEILDVAGKVDYADFLVLMSGKSDRQVTALAQGIEDALRKLGKRALSVEGLPHAMWVLMDFGDVVVHVFQEDSRSLYDLDGLWMDARRIPVPAQV